MLERAVNLSFNSITVDGDTSTNDSCVLIATGASAQQIKAQARSEKMRYMQEEGLLKVMEGVTSMAEMMRGLRADKK